MWPPNGEKDWKEILRPFPPGSDLRRVRGAVEDATKDYQHQSISAEQKELWQQVANLGESAAVTKLCHIGQRIDLTNLPDPGWIDGAAPDRNWLPRLIEHLAKSKEFATAFAKISNPRERLYARLFRIWTDAGGKLKRSSSGPLVDFVQPVTSTLFDSDEPLTGEAIKKAAGRQQKRRRIFAAASHAGKAGLHADAFIPKRSG